PSYSMVSLYRGNLDPHLKEAAHRPSRSLILRRPRSGRLEGLILRRPRSGRLEGWRRTQSARPSFETLAISAFTRVFDALWLAPQDEGGDERCVPQDEV